MPGKVAPRQPSSIRLANVRGLRETALELVLGYLGNVACARGSNNCCDQCALTLCPNSGQVKRSGAPIRSTAGS